MPRLPSSRPSRLPRRRRRCNPNLRRRPRNRSKHNPPPLLHHPPRRRRNPSHRTRRDLRPKELRLKDPRPKDPRPKDPGRKGPGPRRRSRTPPRQKLPGQNLRSRQGRGPRTPALSGLRGRRRPGSNRVPRGRRLPGSNRAPRGRRLPGNNRALRGRRLPGNNRAPPVSRPRASPLQASLVQASPGPANQRRLVLQPRNSRLPKRRAPRARQQLVQPRHGWHCRRSPSRLWSGLRRIVPASPIGIGRRSSLTLLRSSLTTNTTTSVFNGPARSGTTALCSRCSSSIGVSTSIAA
jgi:hypothetical protein